MGTEGENLDALAADFMAEYPDVTVNVTPSRGTPLTTAS